MELWGRVLLGTIGLLLFGALALGDARALRRRAGVPVALVLAATGATVLAGFVHLALTPEHWAESVRYGLFFLVAGLGQLVLGALLTRPAGPAVGERLWAWRATAWLNVYLVAAYVATRVGPRREEVDAIGLVTVAAECAAAAAAAVAGRRLSGAAALRAER